MPDLLRSRLRTGALLVSAAIVGLTAAAVLTATAWLPAALGSKAEEIQTGIKEYQQLRMLKNPIKGIYLMLFLMVTLVIIFGAIWVSVYLARGITGPIQQLAEGTRKVAAGDLSFRVQVKADDEIGMLVDSFNKMTGDSSKGRPTSPGPTRSAAVRHGTRPAPPHGTVLETIAAGVLAGCEARQHGQPRRGACWAAKRQSSGVHTRRCSKPALSAAAPPGALGRGRRDLGSTVT
jgi:two-component system nitrogen regulation sensor histidine kinase NtrY